MRSKNIVFVHGLLGWGPGELGGLPYWGDALEQFHANFVTHEAKCGPLSSFHDRACEIFAQTKGGRVDYGEAHSAHAGHARFSRQYDEGFVPDWSAENPIILVGHSAGAQTCLQLQALLAEDFWGIGSNADWVEAVVSIAGALGLSGILCSGP
jgi:triacylglycerol lipase